jgi:hypothetical protein
LENAQALDQLVPYVLFALIGISLTPNYLVLDFQQLFD